MEYMVGKTAGFCYGVKHAVEEATKELEKSKKVYCLGELVHNHQVIGELEKKGMKFITTMEDAKGKTIIRAHGIPKELYQIARKKEIPLLDLTCPNVLKIHEKAENYQKQDCYIFLIGVKDHPENVGTISFCGKDSCIIEKEEEIEEGIQKVRDSKKKTLVILVQTTFHLEKFQQIVTEIEERLNQDGIKIIVENTICNATRIRQEETEQLAKKVEHMIIIGGKNSSNTKKLYEMAKKNCTNTIMIEKAEELEIEMLKQIKKVGIMAGASTPKKSIEEVIAVLEEKENENRN